MDIGIVESLIASVGFPTAVCITLGIYIWWNEKRTTEREDKREEKLFEEIKYNRSVNAELLETNKLLAKDIKNELTDIKAIVKKEG